MTTINETIEAALRDTGLSGYRRQAEPVVNALVQREQRIFTGIVDAGVQLGASRQTVTDALVNLGMAAPTMQAVQSEDEDDMEDEGNLADRINRLEEFARRNGYNG